MDISLGYDYLEGLRTGQRKFDIGFIMPGTLLGFNKTILPGLNSLAKALKLDYIDLTVVTWSEHYNDPWLGRVMEKAKHYSNVRIHVITNRYEEVGIPDKLYKLYDDLGIKLGEDKFIDQYTVKRFIYKYVNFLAAHSTYQEYTSRGTKYSDPPRLFFRITPKTLFYEKYDYKIIDLIRRSLEYGLRNSSLLDLQNINHPLDILFTEHSNTSGIGDVFWASSIHNWVNIFGENYDIFYERLLSYIGTYVEKTKFKLKNGRSSVGLMNDHKLIPLEGSIQFKHFIDRANKPVHYMTNFPFYRMFAGFLDISSPWLNFSNDTPIYFIKPELSTQIESIKEYLYWSKHGDKFILSEKELNGYYPNNKKKVTLL